tara:strand:+ start:303 stop:422 length:120 start_codon:yes stop_codon:yes gene_type:complete
MCWFLKGQVKKSKQYYWIEKIEKLEKLEKYKYPKVVFVR